MNTSARISGARVDAPAKVPGVRSVRSVPAGLAQAEEVLAILRDLAEGTDLWEDSAITTNEMLEAGTSFANLVLDRDCKRGSYKRRFLDKHWAAAKGAKTDSTAFFVARDAQPHCLFIRTYSRLDYLKSLKTFTSALDGMHVSVGEDRSWTWDASVRTSTDQPLYRTAYILQIDLMVGSAFKAAVWMKTAAADVPTTDDVRADRCVFQLVDEAHIDYGGSIGYERTRFGVKLECVNVAIATRIQEEIFPDCLFKLTPGAKKHDVTLLEITLPRKGQPISA